MAWLISYPADVVKSRLQAQDGFNDQNDNESYDLTHIICGIICLLDFDL